MWQRTTPRHSDLYELDMVRYNTTANNTNRALTQPYYGSEVPAPKSPGRTGGGRGGGEKAWQESNAPESVHECTTGDQKESTNGLLRRRHQPRVVIVTIPISISIANPSFFLLLRPSPELHRRCRPSFLSLSRTSYHRDRSRRTDGRRDFNRRFRTKASEK